MKNFVLKYWNLIPINVQLHVISAAQTFVATFAGVFFITLSSNSSALAHPEIWSTQFFLAIFFTAIRVGIKAAYEAVFGTPTDKVLAGTSQTSQ